ncbi:MAG: DUF3857 domain-containing protein [Holophagaceae bacterium]|nr:DUF3857 domain-containing protein [Holophagaceae bacterium]
MIDFIQRTVYPISLALIAGSIFSTTSGAQAKSRPASVQSIPESSWLNAPALSADPASVLAASTIHKRRENSSILELLEDYHITLDTDGRIEQRYRYVFRVETEAGISAWGSVSADWSPWHEERPKIRARVISPNGKVHLLDPKTIGDYSANENSPQVYDDRKRVSAPLPKLSVGSLAEVEVITKETSTSTKAGGKHTIILSSSVPIMETRVQLTVPENLPLKWKLKGLPGVQPLNTSIGDRKMMSFRVGVREAPHHNEPYRPADLVDQPLLSFTTVPSWAVASKSYEALVESKLEGSDLSAWALEAIGAREKPLEKIAALLARLTKEIRYVGIEFGECAIVPHTPNETLQRGFGDCKDKATLLVALLRSVGIKAHVALLNVSYTVDVDPDLPGISGFDHAIVYVPAASANDKPVWIDPTHEFARAGELPEADQGRRVLVAATETVGLITTPEQPEKNAIWETREIFFADHGKARIVETSYGSGSGELELRNIAGADDPKKFRESIKKYVKDQYVAKDLGLLEPGIRSDLNQPFTLKLEALEAGVAVTDFQSAVTNINRWPLVSNLSSIIRAQPAFDDNEEKETDSSSRPRKSDLKYPNLSTREWKYRLVAPSGYRITANPPDSTFKIGAATLIETYKEGASGEYLANFRLECLKRRWTAEEVNQAREFLKTFENKSVVTLIFGQEVETHLAADRVKEAVASARKFAKLEPNKSGPLIHLARAFLASGLGEAARGAAQEAVLLEPRSIYAHKTLAWVLQHNLISQRFAKGWDPEGALREYRKAIELDPKEWTCRAEMAILLEYNHAGLRYGKGAHLEEALKEYRVVQAELKVEDMNPNIQILLVRTGRFEEAHAFAEKSFKGAHKNTWLILSTLLYKGQDQAMREAAELLPDSNARKTTLLSVGETLVQLRYYPEAAAMLNEGSKGTESATQTQARVEVLNKVRRWETVKLDPSDPRSVVKEYLKAALSGEESLAQIGPFFTTPFATLLNATADKNSFRQAILTAFNSLQSKGVSKEIALDFALTVVPYTLDGDDTKGYRITIQGSNQAGNSEEILYVVKEDNSYRIAVMDSARGSYGIETLRLLGLGDLVGARICLNRIREQIKLGSGDDPIEGHPFARFWTRGNEGSAEEIRVAAAALMAFEKEDGGQIQILEESQRKAQDKAAKARFDLPLTFAYAAREDWKVAELHARKLTDAYPESESASKLLMGMLAAQHRWDAVIEILDRRLTKFPEDQRLLQFKVNTLHSMGKREEWNRMLQSMINNGTASAEEFNSLAWDQVARQEVNNATLETIRHSLQLRIHASSQHTLAAVLAELDRTTEARDTLWLEMSAQGLEEPGGNEWFVLGRIAEKLNETDAAIQCYRRVKDKKKEESDETSCFALSQKRMVALGVKL